MTKLLLALALCAAVSQAQPYVGMVAPNFTLNRTVQSGGGQFTLANYAGEIVYLNFFGYTCGTCISDGWVSEEIFDAYSGDPDFNTAGIDVWNGPASLVESYFRAQAGVSYQLLVNGRTTGYAYDMENGGAVPTDCEARGHIIVDRAGVIAYYAHWDSLHMNPNFYKQQMLNLLCHLLNDDSCACVVSTAQPFDVTIFPLGNNIYRLLWSPVPCATVYSVLGSFIGDFSDEFWIGESQTTEFEVDILSDSAAVFRVEASRGLLTAPPPNEKKGGG